MATYCVSGTTCCYRGESSSRDYWSRPSQTVTQREMIMTTYDDAKAKLLTSATTVPIAGIPLDVPKDHPLRQAHFQPMQPCCCVTEPCSCPSELIWMGDSTIHSQTPTGRQNKAGEEIHEFLVDRDSSVVVESFRRVGAVEVATRHRDRRSASLRPVPGSPFIVKRRPQSELRADPGCVDYIVTEDDVWYVFVESSEHYCIYVLAE